MRSSKSRSRSKGNRSRSMGNIVNRVFDSSGPEGKVRGTPQQIIDKYTQLARDASLGNDRVATENFQQHAEHYTRMLGEAQREMEARREQEQQQRDRQRGDGPQPAQDQGVGQRERPQPDAMQARERNDSAEPELIEDDMPGDPQPEIRAPLPSSSDVIGIDDADGDSNLVETPESQPKPKPKPRAPRKPRTPKAKAEAPAAPVEAAETGGGDS
ncbi:DUF4167 domain-containing protein [Tropicimonas sp.]|uniref:DUF4167 domain-containing protein n=1 Tax=Tropicimonas sp. TaxID=2067044 RepID=UPI003A8C44B4